eukprot:scaffold16582_cov118-Isochrysis_galbana.AAC.3
MTTGPKCSAAVPARRAFTASYCDVLLLKRQKEGVKCQVHWVSLGYNVGEGIGSHTAQPRRPRKRVLRREGLRVIKPVLNHLPLRPSARPRPCPRFGTPFGCTRTPRWLQRVEVRRTLVRVPTARGGCVGAAQSPQDLIVTHLRASSVGTVGAAERHLGYRAEASGGRGAAEARVPAGRGECGWLGACRAAALAPSVAIFCVDYTQPARGSGAASAAWAPLDRTPFRTCIRTRAPRVRAGRVRHRGPGSARCRGRSLRLARWPPRCTRLPPAHKNKTGG